MKDFMQFIQTTLKSVTKISPFPLSVSDAEGYIIGDSNPERIGTFHQPSSDVLKQNAPLSFHQNHLSDYENVFPGVALPLEFDGETIGVLGIIGDPKEVLPYAQLIKRHVEVIWQDTIRSQIEDLETSLLEAFIQYILLVESSDPQKTAYYCEMLHIDPAWKRYCILIDIGDVLLRRVRTTAQLTEEAHFRKRLLEAVSHCFSKHAQDVVAFLNTEKVILIKAVPTEETYREQMQQFEANGKALLQVLHTLDIPHATVAAGGLCTELETMNISYSEAESLIRFKKDFSVDSDVYSYHQWSTLKTLLPYQIDQLFREKLQTRLKPLFQDHQFSELANSFIVYCQNDLNLSKASQALYLHRNTLIYRLKKIEKATALDSGSFTDCMLLYLGLTQAN